MLLSPEELTRILENHKLWLAGDPKGVKANLSRFDLRDIRMTGINLSRAQLSGVNLSGAFLPYANLSCVDLSCASLFRANLNHANLKHAKLSHTRLSHACLNHADLSYANLLHADLSYADLSDANLFYANLTNANLVHASLICDADLNGATIMFRKQVVQIRFEPAYLCPKLLRWQDECDAEKDARAVLEAEIDRLTDQVKELREELVEWLDQSFRQIAHHERETGWWDSMALSTAKGLGDRLVELGKWERHPDGVGRRWFYRPIDNRAAKATGENE